MVKIKLSTVLEKCIDLDETQQKFPPFKLHFGNHLKKSCVGQIWGKYWFTKVPSKFLKTTNSFICRGEGIIEKYQFFGNFQICEITFSFFRKVCFNFYVKYHKKVSIFAFKFILFEIFFDIWIILLMMCKKRQILRNCQYHRNTINFYI